jgi:hypothetical protein
MEEPLKIVILQNEDITDSFRWERACENSKHQIEYSKISVLSYNWLFEVKEIKPQIILTKPGGVSAAFKDLYDECLMILEKELGYFCFPTLKEVLIYENKKYLAYWLEANEIPYPPTYVFYNKKEALQRLENTKYPIIGKTNIGASGSGIEILADKNSGRDYINRAFSAKGLTRRSGPNLEKGGLIKRGLKYIFSPTKIFRKFKKYKIAASEIQKDYIILQEYIPHDYEWRVVRMGDSFFAHKKVKKGDKSSGSLIKEYGKPPLSLLDFVKKITDKHQLYSQAVDIFELDGQYLVNEMQCIFGQSDPYQMLIEDNPGRYIYQSGEWVFEEGDFNTNESYDLRLETAIKLYKNQQ